jgi:hypothetical protein
MNIPRLSAIGVLLIVSALVLYVGSTAPSPQASRMALVSLPDFVQSAPPTVRAAYQFAVTNSHSLETVPCYCGCSRLGHQSNVDCYIKDVALDGTITFDNHAVFCGVCVDITQDVMRLEKEGKSAQQIRTYVDAQYSSFGPSTNTAMPMG